MLAVILLRFLGTAARFRDPPAQEKQPGAERVQLGSGRDGGVGGAEMTLARLGRRELEPGLSVFVVQPDGASIALGHEIETVELFGGARQRANVLDAIRIALHRALEHRQRVGVLPQVEQRGAFEPPRARVGGIGRERALRELE